MTDSTVSRPAFITPADLPGPSGGLTYNRRVMAEWAHAGFLVQEHAVPGAWPWPAQRDRRALEEALNAHHQVLIDGIIASAAPAELGRAAGRGCEISVVVHLPLPAESGLSAADEHALQHSEKAALQGVRTVVATSCWARDDLQRRYGLTNVKVCAPGTDPVVIAPRHSAEGRTVPGDTVSRILFLGALTRRKNPLRVVEALNASADLPWECVVAGPDHQEPEYAERVRSAAVKHPGRISIPGPVDGEDLEALWHRTDVLMLPSRAETYGMVVTEALARGIPAMVGAGTGAEEALCGSEQEDRARLGAPGVRLDPEDTAGWNAALRRWLQEPQLRSRWRHHAWQHRDRLRGWRQAAQELRAAIRW